MMSSWKNWLKQMSPLTSQRRGQRKAAPIRRRSLEVERLEDRLAPATHIWQGANGALWSVAANWNGGLPTSGEQGGTIVQFPGSGGSTSVDDMVGLVVNQIHFTGGGNTINGTTTLGINGLNLITSLLSDTGTNTLGATLPLDLSGATMGVSVTAGTVKIDGNISGSAGFDLLQSNAGTVVLESNANTYTGQTTVTNGTLQLNSAGFDTAVPGDLIVGNFVGPANSAVVQWLQSDELANTATVVVNPNGLCDLNGHKDQIANLTVQTVGHVTTGVGYISPIGALNFNGGQDTLTINASTANAGTASFEGATPFHFSGINTLTYNGNGGASVLTINNPAGGLFAPVGGITESVSAGSSLQNLGGGSGASDAATLTPNDQGSKLIHFENAITQTINLDSLNSTVTDTVSGGLLTVFGTAGTDAINIIDGPVAGQTQVNSGPAPTFATVNFTNKSTLFINGLAGADTYTLNNPNPAVGLDTLYVTGTASQTFDVFKTPAAVTTNITGGGGGNTLGAVNVGNSGSVQGILGTLNIEGKMALNDVLLDNSADTTGRTVTLSKFTPNPSDSQNNADLYDKVHGLAPADINFEDPDTFTLAIYGGGGGNTFNVNATVIGSTNTIKAGNNGDTFNIADNLLGSNSTNNFNGGAGNDTFNVTGALAGGTTLHIDGKAPSFPGSPGDMLVVPAGSTINRIDPSSGSVTNVVTSYLNIEAHFGDLPIADSFTQPNGASLVPIWTTQVGAYTVQSNQANASAPLNLVTIAGTSAADVAVQADVALPAGADSQAGLLARYSGSGDTANMYWGFLVRLGTTTYAAIYRHANSWQALAALAIPGNPIAGKLRFEVVGNSLQLLLNGGLIASAVDAAPLAAGSVGMRSLANTKLDNFYANTLFSDTFTQANGTPLNAANWTTQAGAFTITNNVAGSGPGVNLATVTNLLVADVRVAADVTMASGGAIGLVARNTGIDYYFATLVDVGSATYAVIYRHSAAGFSVLSSSVMGVAGHPKAGNLRFDAIGASLVLYLNGRQVTSATDNALGAGSAGMLSIGGGAFDNFRETPQS